MTSESIPTGPGDLQPGKLSPRRTRLLLLFLLLAATLVVYVGALQFDFVNDDHDLVLNNSVIYSWRAVPQYFTASIWNAVYPNQNSNHYRPVFLLWLRLNDAAFGLRPFGWHLTTILLHVLTTLLVYLLARRLLKDDLAAGISALLFGLHPVHLEAVAWVSGVTEPLVAALILGSFLTFLRYQDGNKKRRSWLAASLALYALALLAKETAFLMPAAVFVYRWLCGTEYGSAAYSFRRRLEAAAVITLPYLALNAVYLAARVHALGALGYLNTLLPLSSVLLTCPSLLWFYFRHLVWPLSLSPYYDLSYVSRPGLTQFILPLLGLLVLTAVLWLASRKSRALGFAALWMAIFILPVLDIRVFDPGDIARDRFLYVPSIGFAVLAGYALRQLNLGRTRWFGQPATQLLSVGALAVLLAVGTVSQSWFWANDLLHASRSVQIAPESIYAHHNLATELAARGRWEDALRHYRFVLAKRPDYWPSLYNLGILYYRLGRFAEADPAFVAAIRAKPGDPRAYVGLGLARWQEGQLADAEELMRRALAIQPAGRGYHSDLGLVLKAKGDTDAALEAFRAELRLYPDEQLARDQIAALEAPQGAKPARGAPAPTAP